MFISLRSRIRQACLLGCASGAALLVLAVGQASAATYPGGGSTFTGSAEGWTGKTECPNIYKVLNIPLLLCTSSAGYTGAAGNPAGSFDGKTEITLNLLSSSTPKRSRRRPTSSPGAGGSGTLKLDRQFAPEGLVRLAPAPRTTRAYLVDRSAGGTKQKAITETIEAASPFITKTGGGHAGRGPHLRDRSRRDARLDRRRGRRHRPPREHRVPPRQRLRDGSRQRNAGGTDSSRLRGMRRWRRQRWRRR